MKVLKRKDKKEKGKFKVLKLILIVLIIIVITTVVVWKAGIVETFQIAREVQKQREVIAEDHQLLEELKTMIELPDEQPLMAIVEDPEVLKEENPFFEKAQKGHRVIVYSNNLAILYDAGQKKILNIGPVNFGQDKIGIVPVAIYNGTLNDQALIDFEEKITTTFNNVEIKVKENAVGNYTETLIIDIKGDNTEIEKIAELLGGIVSELPEGEVSPEDADIMIIVGQNQE